MSKMSRYVVALEEEARADYDELHEAQEVERIALFLACEEEWLYPTSNDPVPF